MVPPEDCPSHNSNAQLDDYDIYTYQLTYVDDNGVEVTCLIDATHVHTDDDHVEIWNDDILLLMMQRISVRNLRNVSVMDMPL